MFETKDGFINLAVGEPEVVRKALLNNITLPSTNVDASYPAQGGYAPLREYLEKKFDRKVVITVGAQQGLQACFYALKRSGHKRIDLNLPYWSYLPKLLDNVGLGYEATTKNSTYYNSDCALLVCPNNPDNKELTLEQQGAFANAAEEFGVPVIHDAAYYSPIYTENCEYLLGDMQVFSYSKMFGLSGLRVGFVVLSNSMFHPYVKEYVERTTAGTSVISQQVVLDVEHQLEKIDTRLKFESEARSAIKQNRQSLRQLSTEIVDTTNLSSNGMFAWVKPGPLCNFDKARILVADGEAFGVPGMVRINLAANHTNFDEAVNRLKALKKG